MSEIISNEKGIEEQPVFLSVVMSTYNDSKYIRYAIESILNQSYPYFEFIIVNDGSTDDTKKIIESYKDRRIVLINKPNTGLVDSLNVGLSYAKYDWIARMDGDDVADINRFKEQIPYIKKGFDLIGGGASYIDMEGNHLFTSKPVVRNKLIKLQLSFGISPIIHPAVIINKKKLLEVGGYDNHIKCAQDKDLWLMLYHNCKMINIPKLVLQYRVNESGISVSKKEQQRFYSLVAFVKFKKHIYRSLTDKEFDAISNQIKNSDQYARLQMLYKHKSTNMFLEKILMIRELITYYLIAKKISKM